MTSGADGKKAFTLIELLIVIGAIGALMAVTLVMNSGATEGARSAKCKSHMRNLAQAVQSYAISHGHYPNAGSYEYVGQGESNGRLAVTYNAAKGWIGWNEQAKGKYPSTGSSKVQGSWNESCMNNANDPRRGAYYAVTNGVLWSLVHDIDSYVCPGHRRACKKNNVTPMWSYAMNAYFGYDRYYGGKSSHSWNWRIEYGKMGQAADRTLLFAEIPFVDVGAGEIFTKPRSAGDQFTDCTLQFRTDMNAKDSGGTKKCNTWKWEKTPEIIGFNHVAGDKQVAHVVFADSHVEALVLPAKVTVDALNLRLK